MKNIPHKRSCVDCIHAGKPELGVIECRIYGRVEVQFDSVGNVLGWTHADTCDDYRERRRRE